MMSTLVLIGIVFLIMTLVLTMCHHAVLGVPYVPTPRRVAQAMVELASLQGDEVVFDLGAGDGRILRTAKRKFPGITAIGYEIVPAVWFLGFLWCALARSGVHLKRGNSLLAGIHRADVVFFYMFPSVMAKFAEKFDRELRPGTIVVSHAFLFPNRHPIKECSVLSWMGEARLFLYRW